MKPNRPIEVYRDDAAGGCVFAHCSVDLEEAIDMQNQPGSGPHTDPADVHNRQAAELKEDTFRGGNRASRFRRPLDFLRSPWKPAPGRLWPGRNGPKTPA